MSFQLDQNKPPSPMAKLGQLSFIKKKKIRKKNLKPGWVRSSWKDTCHNFKVV